MKILDVQQGSPEWLFARQSKFTASEAPAMMGCGWITREQLLRQKKTGIEPEVSESQQRLFDKGHEAEASARPIIEDRIDEPLYPVTGVSDEYPNMLASFDGITLDDQVIYEHKLFSEKLAEQVSNNVLEPKYYWQLEHQLLVADKAKYVIFVVSDGTRENMLTLCYSSVPERRQQLILGWQQFEKDLAAYVIPAPSIVAANVDQVPMLVVQSNGFTLTTNIDQIQAWHQLIKDKCATELETDQDFADRESLIKAIKKAEPIIEQAYQQVIGASGNVSLILNALQDMKGSLRRLRLDGDKLITTKKDQIKQSILSAQATEVEQHLISGNNQLSELLGVQVIIPIEKNDILNALVTETKGKRSLDGFKNAASAAAAQLKLGANMFTLRANENIEHFKQWAEVNDVAALDMERVAHSIFSKDFQLNLAGLVRPLVPKPTIVDRVTISAAEYDQLITDSQVLQHLIAEGVEQWEGYHRVMDKLTQGSEGLEAA
jgi:putative phage-type endonuclease